MKIKNSKLKRKVISGWTWVINYTPPCQSTHQPEDNWQFRHRFKRTEPHGLVPFKDYYLSTPTPEVKLPRNLGRRVQTYQLESQGQVKINLIGDKIEMLPSFGRS